MVLGERVWANNRGRGGRILGQGTPFFSVLRFGAYSYFSVAILLIARRTEKVDLSERTTESLKVCLATSNRYTH